MLRDLLRAMQETFVTIHFYPQNRRSNGGDSEAFAMEALGTSRGAPPSPEAFPVMEIFRSKYNQTGIRRSYQDNLTRSNRHRRLYKSREVLTVLPPTCEASNVHFMVPFER